MQASAIDDTVGVDVLAITDGKGLRVRYYTPDEVPPEVEMFVLDLNTGLLNLTFNDFPNASTVMYNQIQIRNAITGASEIQQLSDAEVTVSRDGFTLSILLNITDLNRIKLIRNLATAQPDTFISIQQGSVLDLAGNPVIEIPTRRADVYIPDSYY